MALVELLQKSGESDFLRAVAEAVLPILMEADVQGLDRRRPARTHRGSAQLPERLWRRGLDTRLGSLQLGIPKLHQGHLRNAPAQCQSQHTTVAAAMRQAFLQADAKTASVGRLNKQVKRRADVIGIFQKEASITRINGGRASRAKCERLLQHRYMQIEGMAELTLAADRSNCLGFERSDPPSVRVHPIADTLDAVEPQRAARVAVKAGIVARVAVRAAARAHLCQPFAFGCCEFHRGSPTTRPRMLGGAGVPRECVTLQALAPAAAVRGKPPLRMGTPDLNEGHLERELTRRSSGQL